MLARALLAGTAFCVLAGISHADAPTLGADSHDGATSGAKPSATAKTKKVQRRVQRGKVSWYGPGFAGRKTASGERFDPHAMTMAHRTLPLGTIVEVTNNENGRHVRVRVNDRGPYHGDRVADLSREASQRLDFVEQGITDATIRVVALPADAPQQLASERTQRSVPPAS